MRRLACISLLLAFACGDGPTSAQTNPPANLSLVAGGGQADTVLRQVDDSLAFTVTDNGGNPVANRLVSFEVGGSSDCGSWAASTLETNADGRVFNTVTFGTDAYTRPDFDCTWQAVQSLQGSADLLAEADLQALPDTLHYRGFDVGWSDPDTITWPMEYGPKDRHGNPVLWRLAVDSFMHVLGTTEGTEDARTLVADSVGTALVDVIHNGAVVCSVPFTVRSDNWIEKSDHDKC